MTTQLEPHDQFVGLAMLGYVEDLLTVSPKESWSKDELLVLLNTIKSDEEMFAPEAMIAYDTLSAEVEDEECQD
jgi:hypothetical protein